MDDRRDPLPARQASLRPDDAGLFIRLCWAKFLRLWMVKAASWNTALPAGTYEYPVSWLDPHTSAVTGLAIELFCLPAG